MAMATVKLVCSTCGIEYTATKNCRNRAEADNWEEYMKAGNGNTCPQCWGKEKREQEAAKNDEKSKEAAELAHELGWAELSGSEKQIAWAETLRLKMTEHISYALDKSSYKGEAITKENLPAVVSEVNAFLKSKTNAKLYIDNRENSVQEWLDLIGKEPDAKADSEESVLPANIVATAMAITEPEERKYPGAVEIKAAPGYVTAKYERNDAFRLLVKSLGYKWDGNTQWEREITKYTGSANDRAVELGNALLLSGFAIRFDDNDLCRRAIAGEYEAECTRWIKLRVGGQYVGYLSIGWTKGDQDIYNAARKIHGSKWDKPNVVVPIECYAEVEDFADMLGFQFSDGAKKAIEAYKDAKKPPVNPVKPDTGGPEDKLGMILESSNAILPDLEDD